MSGSGCCDPGADRMEGRVGNLIGLKLRSSLHHFGQGSQHCRIDSAVLGFRVLFLIPQTDCYRFLFAWHEEGNLVLEAFLFSKQGDNFLVDSLGKLCSAIGFQMERYTSRPWQPPWLWISRGAIQIT